MLNELSAAYKAYADAGGKVDAQTSDWIRAAVEAVLAQRTEPAPVQEQPENETPQQLIASEPTRQEGRKAKMTFEDHEFVTMQHRDHALIQQLEKECTELRLQVDGLKAVIDEKEAFINAQEEELNEKEEHRDPIAQRVDVLETALKWIRDNPNTDADALRDIAITVLLSGLPLCGNCGHPRHIDNSEVCQICRDESINGNRPIEDCCAAYVPIRDSVPVQPQNSTQLQQRRNMDNTQESANSEFTRQRLEEIRQREKDRDVLDFIILRTPTGEERESLTNINIREQAALAELKRGLRTKETQ